MGLKDYCFDGDKKPELDKLPTDSKCSKADKAEILKRTEKNLLKMAELQEKLYADGREGVIFVLQAMDAAGKDSTVKHVMGPLNPQGVDVISFKQPSGEELAHDYLWRAHRAVPRRGKIAIFNRSYYEDVLVVRVHDIQESYHMAERCLNDSDKEFFDKRYRQIRDFEETLYENSYRVVKIFLHVSPEEQKKRFLERIDDPTKNWKFSAGDLKERSFWHEYRSAYETAIARTATEHSPWYVLPADQKWYTRYLVSEIAVSTLEACHARYPELPQAEQDNLAACKAQLLAEDDKQGKRGATAKASAAKAPAAKASAAKASAAKASKPTAEKRARRAGAPAAKKPQKPAAK
ncbi:MAG: polyphosphate kinase 2 family protein [Ruthenibacterium sp.]